MAEAPPPAPTVAATPHQTKHQTPGPTPTFTVLTPSAPHPTHARGWPGSPSRVFLTYPLPFDPTPPHPTPIPPLSSLTVNDLQQDTPEAIPPAQETPAADTRSIAKRLGPAGVLGVIALFFPAIGGIVLLASIGPLGAWLRSMETLGQLVYAGGFMLFAGLALLPTYAQAILGGWAFGFPVGLGLALLGFAGASAIGYCIARPASGDRVTDLIKEKPRWKAVHDALIGAGSLKTFLIVTLVRLPPNSPFALTNLVMAAVKVPLPLYLLGTVIGMAPRTAAAVFLAAKIEGELSRDAISETRSWEVIAASIFITLFVLLVIGSIANRAIRRVTAGSSAPDRGGEDAGSV